MSHFRLFFVEIEPINELKSCVLSMAKFIISFILVDIWHSWTLRLLLLTILSSRTEESIL